MRGIVFDFQRFSLNDGPGIRTVVFLKGCPMRCVWCENPESISPRPQLSFQRHLCTGCGVCEQACPSGAIRLQDPQRIDWARCSDCGACAGVCPSAALRLVGEELSVSDVLQRVLRDRPFFDNSGGGVTVSGGEPTAQYDFLVELLKEFRAEKLNVVLETNGLLPWQRLEPLVPMVNTFYLDIKGIDPELHQQHTGVRNDLILDNARRLAARGAKVAYRVPLIPGLNATPASVSRLGTYLDDLQAGEVHLLPYHKLGEGKLASIRSAQAPLTVPAMNRTDAVALSRLLERPGRKVILGGA